MKQKLINVSFCIALIGYFILDTFNDLNKLNISDMMLYIILLALVFSISLSVKFTHDKGFRDYFVLFISISGLIFLALNQIIIFLIDINQMFIFGYILILISLLPFSFKKNNTLRG